jgi:hypothetical protein
MGAARQNNMLVFTKKYGNYMVESLNNSPIFFSVMLAQASLESGYGTSSAAKKKNNFFGVMSGNTTATFSNPKSAFDKYIELFNKPNLPYLKAGVLNAKTPYEQIRAIADAGYYSMNNDETLKGKSVVRNAKWNGSRWVGVNFTKKQSADWYYNNIKGFVDDALFVLPIGRVNDNILAQTKSQISKISTTV